MGSRDLSQVRYDDGRAAGVELMARRQRGAVTGWVGYAFSRVRFTEEGTGESYAPAWDRRHALDLAVAWQASKRISVSARAAYGSGLPFWPVLGTIPAARLVPYRMGERQPIQRHDDIPVWADEQRRMPPYFRLDLGLAYAFGLGPFDVTANASVLNATSRANVAYYHLRVDPDDDTRMHANARLEPTRTLFSGMVPSVGLRVRFGGAR